MSTTSTTMACDLTVFTPQERRQHFAEAAALRGLVTGFARKATTTQVYFSGDAPIERVREFMRRESRCCSWIGGFDLKEEPQRVVLQVTAGAEAAAVWISSFLGMPSGGVTGARATVAGGRGERGWRGMAWVAATLCLACGLPLLGGLLVARGAMPAFWNLSEGIYLGFGAGFLGLYFGRKFWRERQAARATTDVHSGDGDCAC